VRDGSSAYGRNATRLVFSKRILSPSVTQSGVSQVETVVKRGHVGSYVYGQRSRQTGGRILLHGNPQLGMRLPGVPTVSPVVRYTSCGGTSI
jgi:hypothetical protein